MTKKLLILRHAKSSWAERGIADFERPLNKRGRKALPLLRDYLASQRLSPQLVLCSSARRTRQTLAGVLDAFGSDATIRLERKLYDASPARWLEVLRGVDSDVAHLLIVGHNTALEDLVRRLIGAGPEALRARLETKFPTGALAAIDFACTSWSELQPRAGTLTRFVRPVDLARERESASQARARERGRGAAGSQSRDQAA